MSTRPSAPSYTALTMSVISGRLGRTLVAMPSITLSRSKGRAERGGGHGSAWSVERLSATIGLLQHSANCASGAVQLKEGQDHTLMQFALLKLGHSVCIAGEKALTCPATKAGLPAKLAFWISHFWARGT